MEHRLVAGLVQVPGQQEFVAYSGYFFCGQGMSEANCQILQRLGEHVQVHKKCFILGADFNMGSEVVLETGLCDRLDARLVVPDSKVGTCVNKEGSSTIDYFLIDGCQVAAVSSVEVIMAAALKPHRPVRVTFHGRILDLKVLSFLAHFLHQSFNKC